MDRLPFGVCFGAQVLASGEEVRAEADAFMETREARGRELFTRFAGVVREAAG